MTTMSCVRTPDGLAKATVLVRGGNTPIRILNHIKKAVLNHPMARLKDADYQYARILEGPHAGMSEVSITFNPHMGVNTQFNQITLFARAVSPLTLIDKFDISGLAKT
jgi:hypothetical protein